MTKKIGSPIVIIVKYGDYEFQTRIDKSKFEMELKDDKNSKISFSWDDYDKHFDGNTITEGKIELLWEDENLIARVDGEDITIFSEANLNLYRKNLTD